MSDWCADYLQARLEEEEAAPWHPEEVPAEELAVLLATIQRGE